jgi:hypothetical protein
LNFLLLISCEENFDPYTDLYEGYVLNCVIRHDTTFQVATISRTYKANGLKPMNSQEDFSVRGAKIILTCTNELGTEVYNFRDTVVSTSDNQQIHYYYLDNFQPSISLVQVNPGVYVAHDYSMKIEAELPDGTKLTSYANSVLVNGRIESDYKRKNPMQILPGKLTFVTGSELMSIIKGKTDILPEMIVYYSRNENGIWIDYQKSVPLYYSNSQGKEISIYPILESPKDYIHYDSLVVLKTLGDLSKDDADKENYIIRKVVFYLHLFDSNFGHYLTVQQTIQNEFSLRTTQLSFSNIKGGGGIFGAMFTLKDELLLDDMINAIGYRTD